MIGSTEKEGRIGYRDNSWQLTDMIHQAPGFHILADTLSELTEAGHPIVVGTADLKYSNGLVRYQEKHPERFIQFGISEQNMVSAAAGMAAAGLKPYVATFASFLALLCVEQMRTDTAYTNLPVRMIGHHSGFLLGFYGTSHHATEDLAMTRSMANMTVVAPADPNALSALIRETVNLEGPMYMRIGRGRDPEVYTREEAASIRLAKAVVHHEGHDLTIIATGSMVHPSLAAARTLRSEGFSVGIIDMHTIKPLDAEAVLLAAGNTERILTVEEHNVIGGLGGAVAEILAEAGTNAKLIRHGVQDCYVPVGPPTHLYRHLGLDADGITLKARQIITGAKG